MLRNLQAVIRQTLGVEITRRQEGTRFLATRTMQLLRYLLLYHLRVVMAEEVEVEEEMTLLPVPQEEVGLRTDSRRRLVPKVCREVSLLQVGQP